MGGGTSRRYIVDEQLKPANASDIPDGDFAAAKREVERLRLLIARVDCDMLEVYEENVALSNTHAPSPLAKNEKETVKSESGVDKTSNLESEEGREYWDTLGKPLLREKPSQQQPSFGEDKGSLLESAEGAAYWGGDGGGADKKQDVAARKKVVDEEGFAIVPEMSRQESKTLDLMHSLLGEVRSQIFAKTSTMEEAFLEMDTNKSGYISMTEFRSCLSLMGLFITEEEFELVNLTYPHHEKDKDDDKGISYLEFITMLTGNLTYVPGYGESKASDRDKARAGLVGVDLEASSEHSQKWHSYIQEKKGRESRLQSMFSKKVFTEFYSMKEAFSNMDKDKSGFIDPHELKAVLLSTFNIDASNEDILDMMDKFDSNHDGKLAYHEFVKMLQVDGIAVDI